MGRSQFSLDFTCGPYGEWEPSLDRMVCGREYNINIFHAIQGSAFLILFVSPLLITSKIVTVEPSK